MILVYHFSWQKIYFDTCNFSDSWHCFHNKNLYIQCTQRRKHPSSKEVLYSYLQSPNLSKIYLFGWITKTKANDKCWLLNSCHIFQNICISIHFLEVFTTYRNSIKNRIPVQIEITPSAIVIASDPELPMPNVLPAASIQLSFLWMEQNPKIMKSTPPIILTNSSYAA